MNWNLSQQPIVCSASHPKQRTKQDPKSVHMASRTNLYYLNETKSINARMKSPLHLHYIPFTFCCVCVEERSLSVSFVSSRNHFVAFALRFVVFACHCVAFRVVCVQSHLHTTNCKVVGIHAWFFSDSSFHLLQNRNVRFVFNNTLSVVYLPFCERVRVACVHRLFFVRSSFAFRAFVVRFHLPFKRSPSVQCTFNARFALAFSLNENGKELFNQGCGFWLYTERRSAALPRFSKNAVNRPQTYFHSPEVFALMFSRSYFYRSTLLLSSSNKTTTGKCKQGSHNLYFTCPQLQNVRDDSVRRP